MTYRDEVVRGEQGYVEIHRDGERGRGQGRGLLFSQDDADSAK